MRVGSCGAGRAGRAVRRGRVGLDRAGGCCCRSARQELDRDPRGAGASPAARAWRRVPRPSRVILDFDATPIEHPLREGAAAGHYKGGFGFNPLLVTCGREVLAGVLRPGNAGANNAADHCGCWSSRSSSCPRARWTARSSPLGFGRREPRVRRGCRETGIRFSLGYAVDRAGPRSRSRAARGRAWRPAVNEDGEPREGAWVAELTGRSTSTRLAAGDTADLPPRAPPPRRAALLHRPRRAPLPVLHHRPDRRGHRRARGAPPLARRKSRTASRRSRPPAPATSRSTRSPRTPPGSSSRCSPTTSRSGHSSSPSTASTRSPNPNGCATGSSTSPDSSPATPAAPPCTSPPTGPGPARSSARSSAWKRCACTADQPHARSTDNDRRRTASIARSHTQPQRLTRTHHTVPTTHRPTRAHASQRPHRPHRTSELNRRLLTNRG